MKRKDTGFTLLEVLVATVVLATAITALMSALSTSTRNAARVTAYDRASILARAKMDELLLLPRLPKHQLLEGSFPGAEAHWRARVTPWEMPPNPGAGTPILDRIELEVWWMAGDSRRTFPLEAFRRNVLKQEEIAAGVLLPR